MEALQLAHETDFTTTFDVNFGGFTLKDYREFTSALNLFVAEDLSQIINNGTIKANDVGFYEMCVDEWVDVIKQKSNLLSKQIEAILDFVTYDTNDVNSDISLSYFEKLKSGLLLSEEIFNLTRPEINILRLSAKKEIKLYSYAQNNWEGEERDHIQKKLINRYLTGYGKDKELAILPGMDLLVFEPVTKHLQVIELKYRIPVDSTKDSYNLDTNLLDKAYNQIEKAKEYYYKYQGEILEIYFGSKYQGIAPEKVNFFILTNYSIGMGKDSMLPTLILEINDYINLMNLQDGINIVQTVLNDKIKRLPIVEEKKRCARYKIFQYKILIPEFLVNTVLN